MKNKNYIAFAKGLVMFFAISHGLSYIISSLQTIWIVKEIRKAGKQKSKTKASAEK